MAFHWVLKPQVHTTLFENTTTLINGNHQLLATAVDASGNSKPKKIIVRVSNAGVQNMEQELLQLINAMRSNKGLPASNFQQQNSQRSPRNTPRTWLTIISIATIGSDGSTLGNRLVIRQATHGLLLQKILALGHATAIDVYNAWYSIPSQKAVMIDPTNETCSRWSRI
jgi:hypothetical protein